MYLDFPAVALYMCVIVMQLTGYGGFWIGIFSWWSGTVVERRSLAGVLFCRMLDLQLMRDHLCG